MKKKDARESAIDYLHRKADYYIMEMNEQDEPIAEAEMMSIKKELDFLMKKIFKCSLNKKP